MLLTPALESDFSVVAHISLQFTSIVRLESRVCRPVGQYLILSLLLFVYVELTVDK